MLINVTQEHIDKGQKAVCSSCPIALAVAPLIDPEFRVRVGLHQLYLYSDLGGSPSFEHGLPWSAQRFINEFDTGVQVEPFSFELDIPERFLCTAS